MEMNTLTCPDRGDRPNMDTLKAMAETEYLAEHKESRRTYTDVDAMMTDIANAGE